ncbi:asparagine synthase-related protein [Paenibacillus sp. TRM 82003]|nr:asparagine synthase-related protein [Paenibacillus sp. TRM 82003]
MSAVAGILNFHNDSIHSHDALILMRSLQKYPADDVQTWTKGPVFFGCHAQWITPESINEKNPYYDTEREIAITADAIIDNRNELFDILGIDYHRRRLMGDSELILCAYRRWGEDTPNYLLGDYAFMIWDEREEMLFGARDFSGNRTLYYYLDHERVAFATVLHPLLALPYVNNQLNEQWLAEFLAIPTPADSTRIAETVYRQISQIPPSHSIKIHNGRTYLKQYCVITPGEGLKLKTDEEFEEAFRDVYSKAVMSRLRTYKAVGAQLSGGLDSGSVVGFAARALVKEGKKLHTYSYVPVQDYTDWTPKGRIANEQPNIQSTVSYVGNIVDQYLDFKDKNPYTAIDDWIEALEMPYKPFENSYWLQGIYETAGMHGVGVLLNGQRGNWTVSWGPPFDYQALLLKRMRLFELHRELFLYSRAIGVGRKRVLKVVSNKAFPLLHSICSKRNPNARMFISQEYAAKTNVVERLQEESINMTGSYTSSNAYEIRMKQFEKLFYWSLNGTIGTRWSLLHSLWDRDPTNDLNVIKFCLSVPESQYVKGGVGRSLIRRATRDILPESVRMNQRVRGIQGSDGIHRMTGVWSSFIQDMQELVLHKDMAQYLDLQLLKECTDKLKNNGPQPDQVFNAEFKIAMRSLIFYRFMRKYA